MKLGSAGGKITVALDWKQALSIVANGAAASRLPVLATGLAVTLLAYSAARITWLFFPPPPEAPVTVSVDVVQPTTAPRLDALALSQGIAIRHLLGSSQVEAVSAGNAPIPETALNLQLRGVVASSNPKTASAIIADPAGKEEYFQIGDQLPGGAVLHEVHPQHIVLSRGGRFETLVLPQAVMQMGATPMPPAGVLNPQVMPDSLPDNPTVAPDAGAALQQLRGQFLQDPQALATLLQGEPFRQGGRFVGYRVRPGQDAALFAKFGLQSGDVITALNGVSVVNPQGRLELMRTIGSAEQANVELLRNGAQFSISIPIGE